MSHQPDLATADGRRLDAAMKYAVSIVGRWARDGVVYIPDVDPDIEHVVELFLPVFEVRGTKSGEPLLAGYIFQSLSTREWIDHYQSSPRASELIRDRIHRNLFSGRPLPASILPMVGKIVAKLIDEPRALPQKPTLLFRDTLIAGIAKRVTASFGYHLGASKATYDSREYVPVRACTIAAAACFGFGIIVNPERADKVARKTGLPIEKATERGVFDGDFAMPKNALTISRNRDLHAAAAGFEQELLLAHKYFF